MHPLLRSLRPHQWTKNIFVFAPLAFSSRLFDLDAVIRSTGTFLVFCAAASAIYLGNDLADRERDRLHPLKRLRPLAAGTLSAATAIATAIGLTTAAVAGAISLGSGLTWVVTAYLAINVLYSLFLKHIVILDIMAVSSGYVLRVIAGALVLDVKTSTWLLLCTTFLALFLSASKRRHEIVLLEQEAANQRRVLADYSPALIDQMINVFTAGTLLSYALYAVSPDTAERFGTSLAYSLPFVLYGILRYLYLIYQTTDPHNPTEVVLRDLPSMINGALWLAAVTYIVYG